MQLDDILNPTGRVVRRATDSAKSAGELIRESAVEATGTVVRPAKVSASPAVTVAVLAAAALGAIVAMRSVFRGAIS